MEVLGEVELIDILEGSPSIIWEFTSENGGGIDKGEYDSYYNGKLKAFAYVLGKTKIYKNEKTLEDYGTHFYPQSYVYLD